MLGSFDTSLEVHLEAEARGIAAAVATPDGREGIAAFLERRAPVFGLQPTAVAHGNAAAATWRNS